MLLHAATIFVSAFLLFLIQPVLAKQILPWFGGAAIVWTTCMVFFQLVLLLGYAYAHGLARLMPRTQMAIHVTLLAASLAFLPIAPDAAWKPTGGENPITGILALLFATVGLPYFLLSSTSPLVQSWFARAFPGSSPYRLFALSNFASMSALLGYPFLIEPWYRNAEQSQYWSAGFALFVLLCAALAWQSRALPPLTVEGGQTAATSDEPPPSGRAIAFWLLLSAMGSVTLLAVANHLTQNISSIPLLWVVPLALYLLTFILCFEGRAWYRRDIYLGLLVWFVCMMAWFLADKSLQFELLWHIGVFCLGLFVVCMFCHGELALRRPGPRHLTLFYLVVSLGGVIGGVLVGIVAPLTLPGYLELEIALVMIAAIALVTNFHRPLPVVAMFVVVALFTAGALAYRVQTFTEDTVFIGRNYYGVLRVKEMRSRSDDPETAYRSLVHGAILHGEQWLSEKWRRSATTYYKTTSGIGRTLLAYEGLPIRVGIIGLGAGSIAVYGDADDVYRFYDIDPAVVQVANTYFTYLKDSAAAARRPCHRCFLGRFNPGSPHHLRGRGPIPAPHEARRRDGLPRVEPLPRPEAGAARDRREARARIRLPARDQRGRRHDERLDPHHAQQALHPAAGNRGGDRAGRASARLEPLDRRLQQFSPSLQILTAGRPLEPTTESPLNNA